MGNNSKFAPLPMRVMDGSEPTDITPAAVLSGAPTELQARTVRSAPMAPAQDHIANLAQHLQARKDSHTIRQLARKLMADGLGHSSEGPPMGEPLDGLAIVWRQYARHEVDVQDERRRYFVCE
jgi:hypothetical protein